MSQQPHNASFDFYPYPDPPRDSVYSPSDFPKSPDVRSSNDLASLESHTVTRRQVLGSGMAAVAAIGGIASSNEQVHGQQIAPSVPSQLPSGGQSDSLIKRQARADYQNSLHEYGGWMSNSIEQLLKPSDRPGPVDIDIAIIGSGYGGSICAARLGQQRQTETRICLFERGREWVPGNYPDTFGDALAANRLSLRPATRNAVVQPNELFNFHESDEIDVISGTGLGGTSLINASVAIKPDRDVFLQSHWPKNLRHRDVLEPFYHAAAVEMGVAPGVLDASPKMVAQRRAAGAIGNARQKLLRGKSDGDVRRAVSGSIRPQSPRYVPASLHVVRRLHVRMQCRVEEYGADELYAVSQA